MPEIVAPAAGAVSNKEIEGVLAAYLKFTGTYACRGDPPTVQLPFPNTVPPTLATLVEATGPLSYHASPPAVS